MKLDTVAKRIGLLMVLAACIILICLYLLMQITDYQGVSFFGAHDVPAAGARGYMNALLHEWIGVSFVVFPLLLCGAILLMGYGRKIIDWIKYGSQNDEN